METMRSPDRKLPALATIPVRDANGSVDVNLTKIPADAVTPARDA